MALLFFPAGRILQEESLLRSDHALQGYQRAVRAYHQSLRIFIKLRAFFRRSADENGNAQIYPAAAPALQP